MANGTPCTDDKRAELIYDHYKESFQHIQDHWKARNRLFGLILVVLAAMLFQLTSPNVLERLANSYVSEQTKFKYPDPDTAAGDKTAAGAERAATGQAGQGEVKAADNGPIDFRFITSVLWFVLASLLVQYYQRSILVDRMYTYIERTEDSFNGIVGGKLITREGAFYEADKPLFLANLYILYRWVFFVLLLPVMLIKLSQEWLTTRDKGRPTSDIFFSAADTIIVLAIIYYTVLYLWWSHRERRRGKGERPKSGEAAAGEAVG